MNWKAYWDKQARSSQNPHQQVARSSPIQIIDDALLDRISDHIREQLALQPTDHLLDVCCGNGLLTQRLAKHSKEVCGVDLSDELIFAASQHAAASNIAYQQGDATRLAEVVSGPFDKINLYFSFQYLDTFQKGKQAIEGMLRLLQPGGILFIGDVPDEAYLSVFYPRWDQRLRYRLNLMIGRSMMGKFWKENELRKICLQLGAQLSRLQQPSDLPYAHYRVDYLIRK